jgi:eukaryotic-like serine/threonine-protein kinase
VQTLGAYRLVARLATGGMAEIFLAQAGGRRVVLKCVLPVFAADKDLVAMLLEEARVAAQLSHPNVCRVMGAEHADGRYFVCMEHLEGVSLTAWTRGTSREGAFDLRLLAGLLQQACEGLHHAHERRLVHRDVSPSNLFVTTDGVCKVLDFGIAKAADAAMRTGPGVLKGKIAYMSPEQLAGHSLDGRADVFSLGVVAFEAATGRRLFARRGRRATVRAIARDPIPRAHDSRAEVPPAMSNAIARALSRDPEERHASARDFGADIALAALSIGGALSPREIAAQVRCDFGTVLAARRRRIEHAEREGVDVVDLSAPPHEWSRTEDLPP